MPLDDGLFLPRKVLRSADETGGDADEAATLSAERLQLAPFGNVDVPDLSRVLDDASSVPVAEAEQLSMMVRALPVRLAAVLFDLFGLLALLLLHDEGFSVAPLLVLFTQALALGLLDGFGDALPFGVSSFRLRQRERASHPCR